MTLEGAWDARLVDEESTPRRGSLWPFRKELGSWLQRGEAGAKQGTAKQATSQQPLFPSVPLPHCHSHDG